MNLEALLSSKNQVAVGRMPKEGRGRECSFQNCVEVPQKAEILEKGDFFLFLGVAVALFCRVKGRLSLEVCK